MNADVEIINSFVFYEKFSVLLFLNYENNHTYVYFEVRYEANIKIRPVIHGPEFFFFFFLRFPKKFLGGGDLARVGGLP